MYELIQAARDTYYIDCPAKMGLYRTGDGVWLIDSGNDRDAGRRALRLLDENGWTLRGIINTHSNADHIGGNQFLQKRTGCKILSTGLENAFTRYPALEPSLLFGGFPPKPLRNKFLMARPSEPDGETDAGMPDGLEAFRLPGHFLDMIGVRTPDNVYFLADCLSGEDILEKYHLTFLYDVRAYLETLDWVEGLDGAFYVPAHAPATDDIRPAARANRDNLREVLGTLRGLCAQPVTAEELLKRVFDHYALTMDFNQYVLIGSTVRSCLAWLLDEGEVRAEFQENRLLWQAVKEEEPA